MKRRFCLIRKLVRSLNGKECFIYFDDIERPLDTFGCYGFNECCNEVLKVPFTLLEVVNSLSTKCLYNKSEFNFNDDNKLISIKCGNSFLPIEKKKSEYSSFTQREINKLMKDNF